MPDPDERAVDQLGRLYQHTLWTWAAAEEVGDDDALDAIYETELPLPDGRVAAVGDWTAADLAAVRGRAADQHE